MRELKLRYVVQLLSNLEGQSGKDAKAMVDAQKRVQDALEKTEGKVGRLERVLLRVAGAGTASAERQAMHLAKLAMSYDRVAKAAERFAAASLKAAKNVPQVAAGVTAGGYVLDTATQKPIAYEKRLADMANTTFNDRNAAGRIEGMRALDAVIRNSLKFGGGKRDDAAAALNTLIASGTVDRNKAMLMLPMIMKNSTAGNSSAQEVAGFSSKLISTMGVAPDDLGDALNMALVAGQEGGFEVKDMAKWIGEVAASGSNSGMMGKEGFRRMLASMQAGVLTAGTTDAAGNNLVNLLQKINTPDTAKDFAKHGIDLVGENAKGAAKGELGLDTFVRLTRQVVEKDPRYQAAVEQLVKEGNTGGETDATKAVRAVFQGAGIGTVVQDRQAMMQLIAEMQNQGLVDRVMGATRKRTGETDTALEVLKETSAYKQEQAANARDFAMDDAYRTGKPVFDAFFDSVTKVQQEFPTFASALAGLTTAATAAAAALGAAGLAGLLNGGRGTLPAPGVPGAPGAPGGAPAGPAAGAAGAAAAGGRALMYRLGVGGAAVFAGSQLGRLWDALQQEQQAKRQAFEAQGAPFLSLESRLRLDRQRMPLPPGPGVPGQPDLLSVPGMGGGINLGQGKLDVSVRVTDDRVTATTQVSQPMAGVKINPGNTNPGSYQ